MASMPLQDNTLPIIFKAENKRIAVMALRHLVVAQEIIITIAKQYKINNCSFIAKFQAIMCSFIWEVKRQNSRSRPQFNGSKSNAAMILYLKIHFAKIHKIQCPPERKESQCKKFTASQLLTEELRRRRSSSSMIPFLCCWSLDNHDSNVDESLAGNWSTPTQLTISAEVFILTTKTAHKECELKYGSNTPLPQHHHLIVTIQVPVRDFIEIKNKQPQFAHFPHYKAAAILPIISANQIRPPAVHHSQ